MLPIATYSEFCVRRWRFMGAREKELSQTGRQGKGVKAWSMFVDKAQ
jgi:hypothetical protein